jgi:hypothetical protein
MRPRGIAGKRRSRLRTPSSLRCAVQVLDSVPNTYRGSRSLASCEPGGETFSLHVLEVHPCPCASELAFYLAGTVIFFAVAYLV